MPTLIEAIWKDLTKLGQFPAHKRITADHPLDLYAEISENGRVGLLAVSDQEPSLPPKYDSVDVEIGRRTDTRWAVRLILLRPELRTLFARLCEDIIESGAISQNIPNAGDFVLARLARWRRLLDLGADGLLTDTDIRGLVGELLFLKQAIVSFGVSEAVSGWNGPFDAPQDFNLPGSRYEIKVVHSGIAAVRISSLDQLDIQTGPITLVVYVLQRARLSSDVAFTLPFLVNEVRESLGPSVSAAEEFDARLRSAGYEDRDEYLSMAYSVIEVRYFSITATFPKLIRSELPSAFVAASYDLLLSRCEDFRVLPLGG